MLVFNLIAIFFVKLQLYPKLEATDFETIESYQFIFITDAIARINLPSLGSVPQSQSSIKRKLNIVNNIKSFVITQMLEHVVTQDVFRLGLHHFFKQKLVFIFIILTILVKFYSLNFQHFFLHLQ